MLVALILVETMLFVLLKITKQAVNVPSVSALTLFPTLNAHQLKHATQIFVTPQLSVKQPIVDHFVNVRLIILEILTLQVVEFKLREIVQEETMIVQSILFVKKENVSIRVKELVEQMLSAKSSIAVQFAHVPKDSLHLTQEVLRKVVSDN